MTLPAYTRAPQFAPTDPRVQRTMMWVGVWRVGRAGSRRDDSLRAHRWGPVLAKILTSAALFSAIDGGGRMKHRSRLKMPSRFGAAKRRPHAWTPNGGSCIAQLKGSNRLIKRKRHIVLSRVRRSDTAIQPSPVAYPSIRPSQHTLQSSKPRNRLQITGHTSTARSRHDECRCERKRHCLNEHVTSNKRSGDAHNGATYPVRSCGVAMLTLCPALRHQSQSSIH